MARVKAPISVPPQRTTVLTRLALLLGAAFLDLLGCSDEGSGTASYYPSDTPGAAGALYRPLRPSTVPGAAGSYGLDPTPGVNTGGTAGYSPGNAGVPGRAGAGGASGFTPAGTSATDPYGTAGSAGSYGF